MKPRLAVCNMVEVVCGPKIKIYKKHDWGHLGCDQFRDGAYLRNVDGCKALDFSIWGSSIWTCQNLID